MKKILALLALLAGVTGTSPAQSANPGGPAPAAAAPRASAIDAEELLADVRALSSDEMEGRGAGTPGGERARAYVVERFKGAGLKPFGASYLQPFKFTPPREKAEREGANVVGYVRGSARPERFMVVTAHYDHLGVRGGQIYNGADDNASGVACLLALARHFTRRPPRHSIIFVAVDNEEGGGGGAKKFVAEPPVSLKAVTLNVNLDMISRGDKGELYAAGARHYPFLKPYLERVAATSRVRLLQGHDDPALGPQHDWTFQSDHGAFHRAGVPFVYFGVEDHADYHKPTDDFARVPRDFFTRAAETVLAAV
ncbi:MAG: M20/M25/M40 family metallo-hydrolase, partial [Acidobacteria bacterium]|nr:M20/M25/M40 family metallo-hydrolase [Acidobacteriota bacterium]